MSITSEKIEGTVITVTINSSNLKVASYDTETKTLTTTFNNGSIYDYYEVPWDIFTKLRSAESQGKYFTANIKEKYKFKKK